MDNQKILTRLRQEFEDNPTLVLTALGAALSGIAGIAKVSIEARNSNTWAKEVKRRTKTSRR